VGYDEIMSRLEPTAMRLAKAQAEVRETPPKVAFSCEAFASGHWRQLEVIKAARTRRRILLMMARQAGKSWSAAGIMLDRALQRAGTTSLFMGLTKVAVREAFWVKVWKPLIARFDVECTFNETLMLTTFPNGSRVLLTGTDDRSHIKTYLGNRFAGALIVIDEMQDQKPDVVRELLVSILPPMLTPTTTLLLMGVIPEVPGGPFWDESLKESWDQYCWGRVRIDDEWQDATSVPWTWTPEPTEGAPAPQPRRVWISAINIHTPEAPEQLVNHMTDNGLDLDDPQIMRDWRGVKAFDPGATVYRYNKVRNGYKPTVPAWVAGIWEHPRWKEAEIEPPRPEQRGLVLASEPWEGITDFSFAVDPASTSDKLSIEGIGWGRGVRTVQHIFECVTPAGVEWSQGQWATVASIANEHYKTRHWRYDAGSSLNELDNLRRDYKLPVIACAKKADRHGQVRRKNDLLRNGILKVMEGSGWEEDLILCQRDKQAQARGEFEFSTQRHPDPSEAGRYSLQDYYDRPAPPLKAPKPATPYDEWVAEEKAKATKQRPRTMRRSW
jgi:hypothetical protein